MTRYTLQDHGTEKIGGIAHQVQNVLVDGTWTGIQVLTDPDGAMWVATEAASAPVTAEDLDDRIQELL